jgi:hypothetical protein
VRTWEKWLIALAATVLLAGCSQPTVPSPGPDPTAPGGPLVSSADYDLTDHEIGFIMEDLKLWCTLSTRGRDVPDGVQQQVQKDFGEAAFVQGSGIACDHIPAIGARELSKGEETAFLASSPKCEQDTIPGFVTLRGKTIYGDCVGDVPIRLLIDIGKAESPKYKALAAGSAIEHGGIICVGGSSGLTCANSATGHGFFISPNARHTW